MGTNKKKKKIKILYAETKERGIIDIFVIILYDAIPLKFWDSSIKIEWKKIFKSLGTVHIYIHCVIHVSYARTICWFMRIGFVQKMLCFHHKIPLE